MDEIFIAQPDGGPMTLEILDALARYAFDVIVLDSVPGLYANLWTHCLIDPQHVAYSAQPAHGEMAQDRLAAMSDVSTPAA